jgi:F-type H+-transporting ATPase subunit b
MSIDWITVAAQIGNFLVLVWLLKRFLYRPVLDGIDARERQITERMAEAARIRQHSEAAEAEYQAQITSLRAGREGMMAEARDAAKAERDALLADAHARLTREQAARAEERAEEAMRYTAELQRSGAAALLALVRKALADLAGETLEERIVARAAPRLAALSGDLAAAAGDGREAVVTTREPLSDELRGRLQAQLAPMIAGVALRFTTDPTQSPGLSLRLGGAQLGWTVDSYIDGLERLLHDQAGTRGRGLANVG